MTEEDGRTSIQAKLQDETVCFTQKLMAELFQKDVRTINSTLSHSKFDPIPTLTLPLKGREYYYTSPTSRGRLRGGWGKGTGIKFKCDKVELMSIS